DVKAPNSIKQSPDIDMAYNLNGIDVSWESGAKKWTGSIPHLDLAVSEDFLKPTGDYIPFEQALSTPGKLTFKTKLNLNNMLRPEIQPESTIDYKLLPEDVTLVFKSSEPVTLTAAGGAVTPSAKQGDGYESKITFKSVEKKAYDLEVAATTTKKFALEVYYYTAEDARPRALQIFRFFAPWTKEVFPKEATGEREIPELAGGNWEKGKKLFYGQALCSSCHTFNGKGQTIGPDLSNSVYRDYASVLRDIHEPNASINPDYVAHMVTLKNKKSYLGFISYKKDSVSIRDASGTRAVIALKNVAETKPYNGSIMPTGLDAMLGPQKMKDLLTFLLTNVTPAKIEHVFIPPLRTSSEVKAALKNFDDMPVKTDAVKPKAGAKKAPVKRLAVMPQPFRILWVSGPKDHGPDEHDYPLQQQRMAKILGLMDNVVITKANAWPTQQQFDNADVVVFYWNYQKFSEENGKQLDAFQQRGGGLVYLHYAVDATENPVALANRIGLAWKGGQSKFRHGRLDLQFTPAAATHPITKGFKTPLILEDESYWVLTPGSRKIDILSTSAEDNAPQPMVWVSIEGKGRVFTSIMGHYNWTFDDPLFRIMLFRGILWAGHQPLDRFNDVVTMGARMSN
ncbi:MAG: ThuA domain-containing protein, partial [Mucilaginibacter sp.]